MRNRILIFSAALLLTACGARISYSPAPNVHVSVPVKVSKTHKARLPSGRGGRYKTGRPYRINGRTYYPLSDAAGYTETGIASWYGRKFHGRKTANGERYNMHALSAAHRILPLPTLVRVTNLDNGRQVVVRVNDRGPFARRRVIDLSYAAARALGFVKQGTARVRVQALTGEKRTAERVRPPRRPERTSQGITMYVQLGAFGSRRNATRLHAALLSQYPSIAIYPVNQRSRTLYRVRIGPFNNVQQIESAMLSLQNRGIDTAIVVIE